MAALIGETDVQLDCTVHLEGSYHMEWCYYPEGPECERIYGSFDDVITDTRFDVIETEEDENGHRKFDLIIYTLTEELGLQYACRITGAATDISASAEVIGLSKYKIPLHHQIRFLFPVIIYTAQSERAILIQQG